MILKAELWNDIQEIELKVTDRFSTAFILLKMIHTK